MSRITCTVSGTVIDVLVSIGSTVNIDDDVALIESMKMEIPVASEARGIVAEILVAKGEPISEGDTIAILN